VRTGLVVFYLLATVVILGALGVVASANPVTSVISLTLSLFGTAGLFAFAREGFLAVIQILVYVGAVVTLFTFVVMLLNLREDEQAETQLASQKISGLLLAALLLGNLLAVASFLGRATLPVHESATTSLSTLANAVFGRYALAFELTSVLLLVAVIGVIVLAQRERSE
jgi:NADH-quinone oxidoreductase subunit J